MKQQLVDALQQIRYCRNNMSKEDFFITVNETVSDNNVLVPLLEISSVCTYERLQYNVAKILEPSAIEAVEIPKQKPLTRG